MFKFNIICRLYVPLSIAYRIILSIRIVVDNDTLYGTLISVLICLTFILYNIVNFPYNSTLHNYRATVIHITSLIIVLVANYYHTETSSSNVLKKSHDHRCALLVYVSLMFCTIFSIGICMY